MMAMCVLLLLWHTAVAGLVAFGLLLVRHRLSVGLLLRHTEWHTAVAGLVVVGLLLMQHAVAGLVVVGLLVMQHRLSVGLQCTVVVRPVVRLLVMMVVVETMGCNNGISSFLSDANSDLYSHRTPNPDAATTAETRRNPRNLGRRTTWPCPQLEQFPQLEQKWL